jgi:methionine synthase II (cobalamin-independent)
MRREAAVPRKGSRDEPERLVVALDCGMNYVTRELASRKLEAMVAGGRLVDREAA